MISPNAVVAAFGLGLAGSLHCVGMCGPLVLALPGGHSAKLSQKLLGRISYHLGRSVTYAGMGLFAGVLGKVIQLNGLQQAVSILLGLLLLATVFLNSSHVPTWITTRVTLPLQKSLARLLKRPGSRGLFEIGLMNGLLPCGLVYAALAGASLQEGALWGALYMFIFGLGTAPLLFALSLGGLRLSNPRWRPVLNRVIPGVTCLVAVLLILRGMALGIPYISPDLGSGGSCCPH